MRKLIHQSSLFIRLFEYTGALFPHLFCLCLTQIVFMVKSQQSFSCSRKTFLAVFMSQTQCLSPCHSRCLLRGILLLILVESLLTQQVRDNASADIWPHRGREWLNPRAGSREIWRLQLLWADLT